MGQSGNNTSMQSALGMLRNSSDPGAQMFGRFMGGFFPSAGAPSPDGLPSERMSPPAIGAQPQPPLGAPNMPVTGGIVPPPMQQPQPKPDGLPYQQGGMSSVTAPGQSFTPPWTTPNSAARLLPFGGFGGFFGNRY